MEYVCPEPQGLGDVAPGRPVQCFASHAAPGRVVTSAGPRFFLALVLCVAAFAAPLDAAPSIVLNSGSVSISGLTPGAAAILFTVSREKIGYATGYARHDYLTQAADSSGNTTVSIQSVSPVSVWCVVDLQAGTYATATPEGNAVTAAQLPSTSFRNVGGNQANTLHVKHDFLEVLWVRPGTGAWQASVGDGGASDGDHTVDGYISLASTGMTAIASTLPAPDHFVANDTLIVVDPDTMELSAIRVLQ